MRRSSSANFYSLLPEGQLVAYLNPRDFPSSVIPGHSMMLVTMIGGQPMLRLVPPYWVDDAAIMTYRRVDVDGVAVYCYESDGSLGVSAIALSGLYDTYEKLYGPEVAYAISTAAQDSAKGLIAIDPESFMAHDGIAERCDQLIHDAAGVPYRRMRQRAHRQAWSEQVQYARNMINGCRMSPEIRDALLGWNERFRRAI